MAVDLCLDIEVAATEAVETAAETAAARKARMLVLARQAMSEIIVDRKVTLQGVLDRLVGMGELLTAEDLLHIGTNMHVAVERLPVGKMLNDGTLREMAEEANLGVSAKH